ncbi:hypothetical protein [Marinobacter sp.]|uniref:hypothetical protein n=1 Tax=Marinobacter sp. TaxID=50741 RepID=UPI001A06587F|nr:hypothetical protein [Marinobacter sp.]MBE0486825.1 hypothetical protein [Marinobacter sp.]
MNNNPDKGSSQEENRKSREDTDKVTEEEKVKNQGEKGKLSDKDDAVLGEINDD